jgi:release factor glutamine methyltransferase
MTLHESRHHLTTKLSLIYDPREAANIADWVMEHLTGLKKIDRIVHKDRPLSPEQTTLLEKYLPELLAHKPVQYVLHEAWFCGMPFYVDENVLIPRPETEELVQWIAEEARIPKPEARSPQPSIGNQQPHTSSFSASHPPATTKEPETQNPKPETNRHAVTQKESEILHSTFEILDIGTGSGCIPIALKKQLSTATLYACDISEGALSVAQRNAQTQQTAIQFIQADFLQPTNWPTLPEVNIIVSNPPYIPVSDKRTMHHNVLQHEPHLALFVENDDPLLFYRTIAAFAQQKLLPGGAIYVEIHEDLGPATLQLFSDSGFARAELKKDMQGKDRMIRAMKIN